jgi:hypothetical protein
MVECNNITLCVAAPAWVPRHALLKIPPDTQKSHFLRPQNSTKPFFILVEFYNSIERETSVISLYKLFHLVSSKILGKSALRTAIVLVFVSFG